MPVGEQPITGAEQAGERAAQLWALHDALERRTVVIEIVRRFTVGRRGGQLPACMRMTGWRGLLCRVNDKLGVPCSLTCMR